MITVRRAPWAEVIVTSICVTISLGVASIVAYDLYESWRVMAIAAVGVLFGVVPGAVLARKGSPAWISWAISVFTFVVVVVPLAVPSALGDPASILAGLGYGLTGVVQAWKELLTVSVPAQDYQRVLVPWLVTSLGGTTAAMTLARGSWATRPLATLPMLLMTVFGLAFGSSDRGSTTDLGGLVVLDWVRVVCGAASAVTALVWLLISARQRRAAALGSAASAASASSRRSRVSIVTRSAGLAVAMLAVAGLASVGATQAAPLLPERQGLREVTAPQAVIAAQGSPLSAYRGYFGDDSYNTPFVTVETGESDRIRLVTMTLYDGVTFTVASSGQELAVFERQPGQQSGDTRIVIEEGFSGIWVPLSSQAAGRPVFEGASANELADSYYASPGIHTGVVVKGSDTASTGLAHGDAYTIGGAATVLATSQSFGSAIGADPLIAEQDYPALAAWVSRQGLGRSGADLLELIERLRARGYVSHSAFASDGVEWQNDIPGYVFEPSLSGHHSARIEEIFTTMLDQERRAGDGASSVELISAVGDDEQFAVAAALLARYLGYDSRVVLGFRLTPQSDSNLSWCTSTCTGGDLSAWIEVRDGSSEWLAIDATPQSQEAPVRIREGETPPDNATVPRVPQVDIVPPPVADAEGTEQNTTEQEPDVQATASWLAIAVAIAAVTGLVTLLTAPAWILPVAVALRRGLRKRQREPEVSILSAWAEWEDSARDLGWRVPYVLTRAELADLAGSDKVRALAALSDSAVFSAQSPSKAEVLTAWELSDGAREELFSRSTPQQRLRARLRPSSLLLRTRASREVALAVHQEGSRREA